MSGPGIGRGLRATSGFTAPCGPMRAHGMLCPGLWVPAGEGRGASKTLFPGTLSRGLGAVGQGHAALSLTLRCCRLPYPLFRDLLVACECVVVSSQGVGAFVRFPLSFFPLVSFFFSYSPRSLSLRVSSRGAASPFFTLIHVRCLSPVWPPGSRHRVCECLPFTLTCGGPHLCQVAQTQGVLYPIFPA